MNLDAVLNSADDSTEARLSALDTFTRAYVECALWTETDQSNEQGGDPLEDNYGVGDIAPETLRTMADDCQRFQEENRAALDSADYPAPRGERWSRDELAGHDMWLTRNRHGVGFWDRGLGEIGETLTRAAHAFEEVSLYVGDDGMIYQA